MGIQNNFNKGVNLEFVIMGIALAFNLLVIKWKYEKGRLGDATLDAACLFLITTFFSGTYSALVVGTIASAIISVYLYIFPPKVKFL